METVTRENPARPAQRVGSVVAAGQADVARAVTTAAAAQRVWAECAVEQRAAQLLHAVDTALVDLDPLADLLCRELGKVLPDCRGELAFTRALAAHAAERAPHVLGDTELDDAQGRLVLRQRPYGVVAAVTPWNAPVVLAALKVVPALLAGNAIVVKPSPLAPLTVTRVLEGVAAALPDGLLSVVNGGADTGQALLAAPQVRKVAFTGGAAAARSILHAAADLVVPSVMELGGNDPMVVLDDCPLDDETLERMVWGSFLTAGQVCMAAKRVYVPRTRLPAFVEAYRAVADRLLVVGDPAATGVTVGPLATAAGAARVTGLVDDARGRGATVVPLGRIDDHDVVDDGYFVAPTLVLGLDDDAPLVREEQFGPALPVLAYDDEDEVVRRANADELGLAGSVWSADEERALRVAGRLESGFTFVNSHNRGGMSLRAPFGGVKGSGFGREYGDEGLREYTATHALHVPAAARAGAGARGGGRDYPA